MPTYRLTTTVTVTHTYDIETEDGVDLDMEEAWRAVWDGASHVDGVTLVSNVSTAAADEQPLDLEPAEEDSCV